MKMLFNREIIDTRNNYIQDDFAEAVYVYVEAIKEALGDYFNE